MGQGACGHFAAGRKRELDVALAWGVAWLLGSGGCAVDLLVGDTEVGAEESSSSGIAALLNWNLFKGAPGQQMNENFKHLENNRVIYR